MDIGNIINIKSPIINKKIAHTHTHTHLFDHDFFHVVG